MGDDAQAGLRDTRTRLGLEEDYFDSLTRDMLPYFLLLFWRASISSSRVLVLVLAVLLLLFKSIMVLPC